MAESLSVANPDNNTSDSESNTNTNEEQEDYILGPDEMIIHSILVKRRDNLTRPESAKIDEGVSAAMESLIHTIPMELTRWIQKRTKMGSVSEFMETVYPEIVENAIDKERLSIDLRLWVDVTESFRNAVEETWAKNLPVIIKIVKTYRAKLAVKLDMELSVDPEEFFKFTENIRSKTLSGFEDNVLIVKVTYEVCSRIRDVFEQKNMWLEQNKSQLDWIVQNLLLEYKKVIPYLISESKPVAESMQDHILLKEHSIKLLQGQFRNAGADWRAQAHYKIKLCGLLNTEYNRLVWETFHAKKKPPAPKSYMVREKGNDDIPTRLGSTQIYYYENKLLSTGSSATVYQGLFGDNIIETQIPAAVKRFDKKDIKVAMNEVSILFKLRKESNKDSVNIVKLFVCEEWKTDHGTQIYMAMELADMDLGRKIIGFKEQNLSSDQIAELCEILVGYMHDAAKGLLWLHNKKFIHRDIKPQNILIFSYQLKGITLEIAKIADFGITRVAVDPIGGKETNPDGTDDWAAPEVLNAKMKKTKFRDTELQDIFSLGLVFHFILSLGEHAYGWSDEHGPMKSWNILDQNVKPSRLQDIHFTANDLIQKMIIRNPTERPCISTVLKHSQFWDLEKRFNFLVQFTTNFFEKRDKVVKRKRKEIDEAFKIWHAKQVSEGNIPTAFNWKHEMGVFMLDEIQKRKLNSGTKKYDGESLMSNLDLMRDKFVHSGDICDKLLTDEYFGKGGGFCKRKYAKYFLETFPYVLMFVVTFVRERVDEYVELKELCRSHFEL